MVDVDEIKTRFSNGIFLVQDAEILLAILTEVKVLPKKWRKDDRDPYWNDAHDCADDLESTLKRHTNQQDGD